MWSPGSLASDIDAVTVSHDLQYAVSGADSGLVQMYKYPVVGDKAAFVGLTRQFMLHSAKVSSIDFTADDRYLIATSADGCVSQWTLKRHDKGNYTNVKIDQWHPEGGVYQTDRTRPRARSIGSMI